MEEYQPILNLLKRVKSEFVQFNDHITRLSEAQNQLEEGTNSLDRFISSMSIQKELLTFSKPDPIQPSESKEPINFSAPQPKRKSIFANSIQKNSKSKDEPIFDYHSMRFNKYNYRHPTIASLARPIPNTNNGSISLTSFSSPNDSSISSKPISNSIPSKLNSNSHLSQRKRPYHKEEETTKKNKLFSLDKCREYLPKKYQTDQHIQKLEQVLRFIGQSKNEGCRLAEITKHIQCGTIITNEYLNALIKIGEIERINKGSLGMIYKLEPYKYIKYLDPK